MSTEWKQARKKPVKILYREVQCKDDLDGDGILDGEIIHTLEGDHFAKPEIDFIIQGINGEFYPIKKTIFAKTYDVILPDLEDGWKANPKIVMKVSSWG